MTRIYDMKYSKLLGKIDDWGRWEPSEENEALLREALESGEIFDSGYHGFSKLNYNFCVERHLEDTTVLVSNFMDSALETDSLFYDFLTDEEYEEMLTEERIEEIRRYLYLGDYEEQVELSEELSADATYEDIMAVVDRLGEEADQILETSFKECIEITLGVLYADSEDLYTIIEERINEYCRK